MTAEATAAESGRAPGVSTNQGGRQVRRDFNGQEVPMERETCDQVGAQRRREQGDIYNDAQMWVRNQRRKTATIGHASSVASRGRRKAVNDENETVSEVISVRGRPVQSIGQSCDS